MNCCEIEPQSELEPNNKVLVAFDLDGSVFHGPDSWKSILEYLYNKNKTPQSEKPNPHSSPEHQFAKPILQLLSHSVRHINQNIFHALYTLQANLETNQIPLDMAVISGRSEQTLGKLTRKSLQRQGLTTPAFFQDNIYLKPNDIHSWQFKFEKMQELIKQKNYSYAFLFENNPVAAAKIATEAKANNLPIHILLHQGRLESSQFVLNRLGLDPDTLAKLNIHPVSIDQIPSAIDSILFPNQD